MTTVYLVPLIAMQEQLNLRCTTQGMSVGVWNKEQHLEVIPDNLLVILETASSASFRSCIASLHQSHRLARIVVDEAHLILAHRHFRANVMDHLTWVGQVGVPVIVQSATIPPSILPHLFAKLGVSVYHTCRQPTPRPNIRYTVVTVLNAEDEVARLWAEACAGIGKTLIFCLDKNTVTRLSNRLSIEKLTGDDDLSETTKVLSRLRAGTIRGIVCTIVLGVALDVPNVDLIVHCGCPYNMVGYSQETGRAGRTSDSFAKSVVVLQPSHAPNKVVEPDYMGARLMHDHLHNDTLCRNYMMTLFNDGIGLTCTMMSRVTNYCDICEKQTTLPPGPGTVIEYSSDMILPYLIRQ